MEDLKIKVNNEAESKEAQELLKELGYKLTMMDHLEEYDHIEVFSDGSGSTFDGFVACFYKEVLIPQLKDMVVLKRNCVDDATHTTKDFKWFVSSNSAAYSYFKEKWNLISNGVIDLQHLKPIEKEMKEWINKVTGEYKKAKCMFGHSNWVEVPDGAEIYAKASDNEYSFWRGNCQWLEWDDDWSTTEEDAFAEWKEEWNPIIIWQRPQQPDSLPFVDDETLGEKIKSTEVARQSAWNKQEGGSHYKNLAIQPMEYALKNKLDYAQANVVKYVTRHAEKNGKEDLLKAIHNIELMIEHYYL